MTVPNITDEEVALRVQNGNKEAFGVLIERYETKMTRYAKKFLFGHDDTADLVQEVFIKAYVNIRSFDTTRAFSPWLYRIAHNEFINAIKRKKQEPIPFFDADTLFPHPIAKETSDGESKRREISELVEGSLGNLDPKYREPLVLYYLEELSYQEIAEVLHIPISTVGVRISRGKELLRKEVRKDDHE